MPRTARIVIRGIPHHVTQRGNNRQDVFFTTDDRRVYLYLHNERCTAAGVRAANPTGVRAMNQIGVRPFDSAAVLGLTTDLLDLDACRTDWTAARWRRQLGEPTDEACLRRFWRAVHTGRPLAEDRCLVRLEARLGRRLRANPIGRPRKTQSKPGGE